MPRYRFYSKETGTFDVVAPTTTDALAEANNIATQHGITGSYAWYAAPRTHDQEPPTYHLGKWELP